MLNQILIINKSSGPTSRDVINELTKILGTKKIGHTGTLDPIASGVLVCLTGKYTKLVSLITAYDKEYIAKIKLGICTDTLDITGNVIKNEEPKVLSNEEIIACLNSFKGKYLQEVPKYAAVSLNGKRLYEYARNNIDVLLPKREVEIKNIELLDYDNDYITFKALVSKGTYIRSLINDICNRLQVIGTMSSLVRTKQGNFKIEDSYTIEDIINNNYKSLSIKDILDIEEIELTSDLEKKVVNGNKLNLDYDGYILFKKNNNDIALYFFEGSIGRLIILF